MIICAFPGCTKQPIGGNVYCKLHAREFLLYKCLLAEVGIVSERECHLIFGSKEGYPITDFEDLTGESLPVLLVSAQKTGILWKGELSGISNEMITQPLLAFLFLLIRASNFVKEHKDGALAGEMANFLGISERCLKEDYIRAGKIKRQHPIKFGITRLPYSEVVRLVYLHSWFVIYTAVTSRIGAENGCFKAHALAGEFGQTESNLSGDLCISKWHLLNLDEAVHHYQELKKQAPGKRVQLRYQQYAEDELPFCVIVATIRVGLGRVYRWGEERYGENRLISFQKKFRWRYVKRADLKAFAERAVRGGNPLNLEEGVVERFRVYLETGDLIWP